MTTEALTAIKAALEAGPTGWIVNRKGDGLFMKSEVYDQASAAAEADIHDRGYTEVYDFDPSAISSLISSYEAMERRVARLETHLNFVTLWAWREDPPNSRHVLSDNERLSVIKNYPPIKDAIKSSGEAR